MTWSAVVAYTGLIALLTITPGVDMALVARSALADGRRAAVGAAAGIATGTMVWGTASALGVAAVLAASATAYDALRLAGAVYLVWLGCSTWRRARTHAAVAVDAPARPRSRRRSAYLLGLASNLANPKIVVFYSTVLPTFIPKDASVLLWTMVFAGIHALLGLLWLSSYAWLLTRARAVVDRPAVRAALDRVTGTVLVAFGLRLAAER
ncbi:MAG: yrhP [Solirubrobacterales bacterium]|nr:yrhP [Solirubrobacterales bacterium]